MIYMICYDISDEKRLRKVATTLERYGLRVQKSFFQLETDKKILDKIVKDLLEILNLKEDYLFIYPLCESCTRKAIKQGKGELIRLEAFEIL
ncbi:MAG: CRISPR-associated endonuclease Cas2 [Brevinematia bacterium]